MHVHETRSFGRRALGDILVGASMAAADAGEPRCTLGEAEANFYAPFQHFVADDLSVRFACQYRFHFDGRAFTYCEDDVILGGTNLYVEYKPLGWSRAEGIAYIERVGTRVWIDGIEQPLIRTGYMDGQQPVDGHSVYQHVGFITQLPIGDHVSYFEDSLDGIVDFTATVQLHILPRTDALCS